MKWEFSDNKLHFTHGTDLWKKIVRKKDIRGLKVYNLKMNRSVNACENGVENT